MNWGSLDPGRDAFQLEAPAFIQREENTSIDTEDEYFLAKFIPL